jgi:N-acetyl-alpha-D-glucosaminyl L-malate synthase BshA
VATELGIALAEKGHEVHFITYDQPVRLGSARENIFYHEVQVSDYPLFKYAPYELVLTSKLVDVVKYNNLDLLHVHYAIPHASAAYMAREILKQQGVQIPFITTLHGTDITLVGRDKSFEPVITFAINNSDAVTAVSHSLKVDTLEYFDINRPIEVIHNFIDNERYAGLYDQALRDSYANKEEKIITHVSNFRPVKRIDDIVRAFAKVRARIPAKLLLVGDGPDRHKIQSLCTELNTCDSVIMLGKLKKPEQILAISDLYLQASEHESFGLSILEAMSCGVPAVATSVGGVPEVVEHGVSGLLSEVKDVDALADNVLKILNDDAVHEQYKKKALQRSAQFDISNILPQYEALYKSCVKSVV